MTTPRLRAIEPQIADLSPEELRELVNELIQRADAPPKEPKEPKKIDWDRFRGILKHGPDGLEYQRAIRAEWG